MVLKYIDENVHFKKNILGIWDDKIFNSKCVNRRPDRLYDMGTFYLIVEVDENQHKDYKCVNTKYIEEVRMIQIADSLGMETIFIRFNPDNFRVGNKLCRKYNMTKRLKVLRKWLLHFDDYVPDKNYGGIKSLKLFYDEYDETNTDIRHIDPMVIRKLQETE